MPSPIAKALREKIELLSSRTGSREVASLERAYNILGILDSKATGLMTVNAFLGAFPVLSIEHYRNAGQGIPLVFALLIVLGLVLSALLCFTIVRIDYDWYQYVATEAADRFADRELENLTAVIVRRTWCYRWAWRITLFCLLGMVVLALWYALGS